MKRSLLGNILSKREHSTSSQTTCSRQQDRYIPTRSHSLYQYGLFRPQPAHDPFPKLLQNLLLPNSSLPILSYANPKSVFKDQTLGSSCFISALPARPAQDYRFNYFRSLTLEGMPWVYEQPLIDWSKNGYLYIALLDEHNQYKLYAGLLDGNKRINVFSSRAVMGAGYPSCIQAVSGNKLITTWSDARLRIHRHGIDNLECIHELAIDSQNIHVMTEVDDHQYFLASSLGEVYHLDIRQSKPASQFRLFDAADSLESMSYNQSNLLAFGSSQGYVKVYDKRRLSHQTYYSDRSHHTFDIRSLAFNPNQPKELLSAAHDLVLRHLDVGDRLKRYAMLYPISSVHWLEQDNCFLAGIDFAASVGLFMHRQGQIQQVNEMMKTTEPMLDNCKFLFGSGNQLAIATQSNQQLRFFSISGLQKNSAASSVHVPQLLRTGPSFTIR